MKPSSTMALCLLLVSASATAQDAHATHAESIQNYVSFNRLETWNTDAGTGQAWEGLAWLGTDSHRLWLRSEGERMDDHLESADLEVLYGRPISRWWDLVAGIRHDFAPGASRDFAAIGVIGLAPYKFQVAGTAYIGQSGHTAARVEVEYETLITNRLVLQPQLEIEINGKDDRSRGIGSGLSTVQAGLRLRYEINRRFAPYVGVVHERAFGRTAGFRNDDGHPAHDSRVVLGARIWF